MGNHRGMEVLSGVGRECMEDNLASVYFHYTGFRYHLVYMDNWKFDYVNDEKMGCVGEKLAVNWPGIEKRARELLGIETSFICEDNPEMTYAVIAEGLKKGKIYAFTIDIAQCEWNSWHDMESGREHTLLVWAIDLRGDFLCCDCQENKVEVRLSKEKFVNGYRGLYVDFTYSRKLICGNVCEQAFLDSVKAFYKSEGFLNVFCALQRFSEDIMSISFERECTGDNDKDIWDSPLFHKLNNYAVGHKQYAYCTQYIAGVLYDEALDSVSRQLIECAKKWGKLRNVLMKALLAPQKDKLLHRSNKLVIEITKLEKEIYMNLERGYHGC